MDMNIDFDFAAGLKKEEELRLAQKAAKKVESDANRKKSKLRYEAENPEKRKASNKRRAMKQQQLALWSEHVKHQQENKRIRQVQLAGAHVSEPAEMKMMK